ncbi:beta carbonic anhydrase 5, chloroplastic-like isoform X2 [Durio zibethinus]|uniref:Carbonic anhydrase n=1 Tax=Durio zibethinus TaxID=66656 RepID=A0A6P6AUD4_DURZI|nr:beta carbonic anhydrase 5, chloroplastic-like isoform X2 [Durio zibethinus]
MVNPFPGKWFRSKAMRMNDVDDIQSGPSSSPKIIRRPPVSSSEASSKSLGLQEFTGSKVQNVNNSGERLDLFDELKRRFLSFKKHKYLEELEHFQTLKEAQSPKFMVIACADSRVCPSTILGFRPGEAFMIRNVANLVPPVESGPSETNAALEFAVKTLEVENILIIGHSCCGGIQTLMSMRDNGDSSFIKSWVTNGKIAKLRTEAAANHLNFDQQCRICEKESINHSLLNLLTYPWIKDRVRKGLLFVHGGYYDFLNCTFEKWTLDFKGSSVEERGRSLVRDQELWC